MPPMQPDAGRRMRFVRIGPTDVTVTSGPLGATYIRSVRPLGPYPARITDCLEHWAEAAPNRTFLAERAADGEWRRLTYAEALRRTRSIAEALLARRLSPERPIAIIS